MKIQERSFSGKIFRPKPQCYISSNKKVMAVITPWGQEATSTREVFENIEAQYNFFKEDEESTHPFPKMMSLTPTENNMRTTVMQVNNNIFHHINQDEYAMGLELFFATIVEHIFTFIQIGQPFILIDRPHQYLSNIGHVLNPSLDTPTKKDLTSPPLPHQLLGVHDDISLHSFFFRFQPTDHLILLNRNTIPTSWFHLKREERTLDNLSQKAAEDNPLVPFWMAIVQLHTEQS